MQVKVIHFLLQWPRGEEDVRESTCTGNTATPQILLALPHRLYHLHSVPTTYTYHLHLPPTPTTYTLYLPPTHTTYTVRHCGTAVRQWACGKTAVREPTRTNDGVTDWGITPLPHCLHLTGLHWEVIFLHRPTTCRVPAYP